MTATIYIVKCEYRDQYESVDSYVGTFDSFEQAAQHCRSGYEKIYRGVMNDPSVMIPVKQENGVVLEWHIFSEPREDTYEVSIGHAIWLDPTKPEPLPLPSSKKKKRSKRK